MDVDLKPDWIMGRLDRSQSEHMYITVCRHVPSIVQNDQSLDSHPHDQLFAGTKRMVALKLKALCDCLWWRG